MFYDLNVPINKPNSLVKANDSATRQIIESALVDGYGGIAFNYEYSTVLTPKDVSTILNPLMLLEM
jgi:bifunctional ADP-heptose synthase (sugar kinase/adenylyltransferase)